MRLHLLQICNVGQVSGGTGACTLSVVKSLPHMQHSVVCLGRISSEMSQVFEGIDLYEWQKVSQEQVDRIQPDLVLFHNTNQRRVDEKLSQVTIQYMHSRTSPPTVDRIIYCSRWLGDQYKAEENQVCYQSVFKPMIPLGLPEAEFLSQKEEWQQKEWQVSKEPLDIEGRVIRVGRLCTPRVNKWPGMLVKWYEKLAARYPRIHWEFVGCPEGMQQKLREACNSQAVFIPANWESREYFWEWDMMLYHNPDVTESFGRTVAEAMRAGCIPVVDRRGGFCEQVTSETGYLCGSQLEFEKALDELMDDDLRKRMSVRCKDIADERFSLRRFGDDLLVHFQAACCSSA